MAYHIGQIAKAHGAEGSPLHLTAHAILGVAVAAAGGNSALVGAASAITAEAAAPMLAQYLYNKESAQLTAEEKHTIQAIANLAGAGIGASTGSYASIAQGGQSASNAVGNNNLSRPDGLATAERALRQYAAKQFGDDKDNATLFVKTYEAEIYTKTAESAFETIQDAWATISNPAETVQSLYEVVSSPVQSARQIIVSLEEWDSLYQQALKNDAVLAGKMKAAWDAKVGTTGAGMVLGAGLSAVIQKSIQTGKVVVNVDGYPARSAKTATQLRTELAFREAGILDGNGKLTDYAISNAQNILLGSGTIKNPQVVKVLTKDGSQIEDWTKMRSPDVRFSSGEILQIHFYQNNKTGRIDYETKDFKVKGELTP